MNKKSLLIAGIIIIVLAGATIFLIRRANNIPYELAVVQRGNMIQEVSASGKVESPTKIDLHFRSSGKLVSMNAKVSDKVSAGDVLAKQDSTQLDAQVFEMQASIDLQKAKLDQLLSGVSVEDINLSETAVTNAKQALQDAKYSLIDKVNNSYTKSDDAVRGKTDQLFSNPKTSSPQLVFISSNGQLENDVEGGRVLIEEALNKWVNSLGTISAQDDLSSSYLIAEQNTNQVKSFIEKIALLVNALTPSSNTSQTTIDKWKTDISTARTNIDIAISNLLIAGENLKAKEAGLKTAESHLALKKAPARPSDIAVYQSQISQAKASLQRTQSLREDLIISAPLSGVVTEVNGEVGEVVGPDKTIISLATGGALQIKLNVVEDNIVNVRVGQEARITFDSIDKEEFFGKVVAIDPAETIIGGAVYYKTTVLFEKMDERIKSGMTANVWIETAISENTLFVPVSAVQDKDGKKIVQVFEEKQVIDKEVTTGIKNDLGMIEITSGLSLGEQVVLGNKK
ncbi:MAG: efflux RND transporter periplasmic adaptor subunit [Candidatus Paceibacterota bacterium]